MAIARTAPWRMAGFQRMATVAPAIRRWAPERPMPLARQAAATSGADVGVAGTQAAIAGTSSARAYLPPQLKPAHFLALLRSHGTTFYTGSPDSALQDFCACVADKVPSREHIIAANEGRAMASAASHHRATGRVPCVYMQSFGLGSPASHVPSFGSAGAPSNPALLLIGLCSEPGKKDIPQAAFTPRLLREKNVPYEVLPDYAEGAFKVLDKAYKHMQEEKSPFALLVRKDTFDKYKQETQLHASP